MLYFIIPSKEHCSHLINGVIYLVLVKRRFLQKREEELFSFAFLKELIDNAIKMASNLF